MRVQYVARKKNSKKEISESSIRCGTLKGEGEGGRGRVNRLPKVSTIPC